MDLSSHSFVAIAEIDVYKGEPRWVDTAKVGGRAIPKSFVPGSDAALDAANWIWAMESNEYPAGFIWEIIPYTPRALAEFAGRNAEYCKG